MNAYAKLAREGSFADLTINGRAAETSSVEDGSQPDDAILVFEHWMAFVQDAGSRREIDLAEVMRLAMAVNPRFARSVPWRINEVCGAEDFFLREGFLAKFGGNATNVVLAGSNVAESAPFSASALSRRYRRRILGRHRSIRL